MTPGEAKANGKNVPGPGSTAGQRPAGAKKTTRAAVKSAAPTDAGQAAEPRPLRLGIIDDHPVYRLGLLRALQSQPDLLIVWDLGSASELAGKLKQSPVDVVLMDVNLGGGVDGVTAAEALKRERNRVKVVLTSALADQERLLRASAAGAAAYLPKDLTVNELLGALRSVARSEKSIAGDLLGTVNAVRPSRRRSLQDLDNKPQLPLSEFSLCFFAGSSTRLICWIASVIAKPSFNCLSCASVARFKLSILNTSGGMRACNRSSFSLSGNSSDSMISQTFSSIAMVQ